MNTNTIFKDIGHAITRYQEQITEVLNTYRNSLAIAQNRYNEQTFVAEKKKLDVHAQWKIEDIGESLSDALKGRVTQMRAALAERVAEPADRDYVATLRDFRDFGLTLTRPELDALLQRAGGNYSALRLLQSVAAQSGFRIAAPTFEDYESDIVSVEQMARLPVMWVPDGFLHEAAELYPDRPIFRPDGSVAGTAGRPESAYLLLQTAAMNGLLKNLDEIAKLWSGDFTPEVVDAQMAQKLGRVLAETMQESEKIRSSYNG